MKIRIKGPSIRLRLSKSEVHQLVHEGRLEEATPFAGKNFVYALQKTDDGDALSANFEGDIITMYVPQQLIQGWDTNTLVTIDAHMPLPKGDSLYLLLEKDFQCLDKTEEDQSDNYINPNKTC
jgi:hypothetical protein